MIITIKMMIIIITIKIKYIETNHKKLTIFYTLFLFI